MARDQAYHKAEKKIEEALKSGATELDLNNMGLTELPESIGKLTQLKSLDLSENQLVTLPQPLRNLLYLEQLILYDNQFSTVPEWIGEFNNLKWLGLGLNRLKTLPKSLTKLRKIRYLTLWSNQITELPEGLRHFSSLEVLSVSSNRLANLPDWLQELNRITNLSIEDNPISFYPKWLLRFTQLKSLGIGGNRDAVNLPEWLGEFAQLEKLKVQNSLTTLPEWIRQLKQLEELDVSFNNLEELPEWLKYLTKLQYLRVGFNSLNSLPEWLGESILKILYCKHNKIRNIPVSISHLGNLQELNLDENPLNPALQSAYDQGLDSVKAYLRSLEQNAEPLYEAKLVLVGEGGVGKTTLLNALMKREGRAPKQDETTTHGVKIDVNALQVPHPEKEDIKIQLNAWDFGGQDVYRVTHQFFFSRRSLYLLVWEPRRGVQQCQVEDWLNMIRLRVGDEARVVIISTNSKSGGHIARIDQPVFKQQYGKMIAGFHEVDSLVPDKRTGEMVGIAELKQIIAEESAKLEQMGMLFNNNWKAARDELLACPEPRISYTAFSEICAKHSLSQIDTDTLAHLMHDLGYIVHYSDDENLRDDVVLKPEWLTKAIGFVLEDRATQESEGILPDNRLHQVWHDHTFEGEPRYDSSLYPFFLHLMEKYDVSYRLPDGKASLVAQHVPQVRPELPWMPENGIPEKMRRIAMICAMEEDPPGLVPWMIVRTHDYAVEQQNHRLHWQKGMFLNHGPHGEAMLEKRGREFHVYAQANWPEYFMNVLQHTLQKLIDDNWPGLEGRYGFMVPCPEAVNGQPCKGRFKIQALRQFLAEGDTSVRCQECSYRLSIAELLFGFEERDLSVQLREIKEQLTGMDSRIANYFMAMMHAIADEAKSGPRLFTFRARDTALPWQQILSQPMEIQLWCEAEGHQHPVIESGEGLYPIDMPYDWVVKIAPYANFVLDLLKTVAPMVSPAINVVKGPKTTDPWKDRLDLGKAIIDKLPAEIKTPHRNQTPGQILSEPERSGILALHRFLNEVDPTQAKLGLHRVSTYTGDYRWLCRHHYDAWQPNIPDVI